jgi:enterochelin esterase family protein
MPEYEFVVVDLVRYAPRAEIEIWMDAGSCEGLLDGNKQMHALLKEKKYKVKYHEYPGGHNYTSWRNDIWRGLEALFR